MRFAYNLSMNSNNKIRKCRYATNKAIQEGKLKMADKCEVCGSIEKLEIHHNDYDNPYNILTLCQKCHREIHKKFHLKSLYDSALRVSKTTLHQLDLLKKLENKTKKSIVADLVNESFNEKVIPHIEESFSGIQNITFTFNAPLQVSESTKGKAIIKGVLLKEGVSRNGHVYTIDEMEKIAVQCKGIPIEFGVDEKNRHVKSGVIGHITKAWLDKGKRKIRFIAEVIGDLAHKVKKGWGISIDGIAKNAHYVLGESGRLLIKIKNLILKKIQLLPPSATVGVVGAGVSEVEIAESFIFGKGLISKKTLAILVALESEGVL